MSCALSAKGSAIVACAAWMNPSPMCASPAAILNILLEAKSEKAEANLAKVRESLEREYPGSYTHRLWNALCEEAKRGDK